MSKVPITLSYYLVVSDFLNNVITIPTSNLNYNPNLTSLYFSGVSKIYDTFTQQEKGNCSASFLCINDGVVNLQISNYLYTTDGLIISWFTPTTLPNLIIDELIFGLVTECEVTVTTKVGFSLYYGKKFNLNVSTNNGLIYFNLTEII